MTTEHAPQQWWAGDDWQINATLLDADDEPINLVGVQIKWALMNYEGNRALDEDDVSISITSAIEGKCSIQIFANKTTNLSDGRYRDVIRIVSGGITSTLCFGVINVVADPWRAAEVMVVNQTFGRLRRVA